MTTKQTQLPAVNPLPDPPGHEPDDMTTNSLAKTETCIT